jgi:hypothetical protein
MVKLTDETVAKYFVYERNWTKLEISLGTEYVAALEQYISVNKRYKLRKCEYSNLFDPNTGEGWILDIDDSNMCSLANCDVEYVEQVLELIKIYADY